MLLCIVDDSRRPSYFTPQRCAASVPMLFFSHAKACLVCELYILDGRQSGQQYWNSEAANLCPVCELYISKEPVPCSAGRLGRKYQRACKPGSVHRLCRRMGDHSSRDDVAIILKQPTRATGRRMPFAAPIWSCSRWGLPCHCRYRQRGALLPHRFDLAVPKQRWFIFCGTIPGVAPGGRYPPPFLAGARTFLPRCTEIQHRRPPGPLVARP